MICCGKKYYLFTKKIIAYKPSEEATLPANWKDAGRAAGRGQETEIFLRAAHARMLVTHRALRSWRRAPMLQSQANTTTTENSSLEQLFTTPCPTTLSPVRWSELWLKLAEKHCSG